MSRELSKFMTRLSYREGARGISIEDAAKMFQSDLLDTITAELGKMEADEAKGWDILGDDSCCPGDDAATGYNQALSDLQTFITKLRGE